MIGRNEVYLGRTHIEEMRRQITWLEFQLMNDGDPAHVPDAISCHRLLGNIVAQADAITILVEDANQ